MKTKQTKMVCSCQEVENPSQSNPAITLLEFKNIEYEHFDDFEFLDMLQDAGFLDEYWSPSRNAIENGVLFLQDYKASQTIPDVEFTSKGKLIMVENFKVLGKTLETKLAIEHLEFLKCYALAMNESANLVQNQAIVDLTSYNDSL